MLASAVELELDPLSDTAKFPPGGQTMQYNENAAAYMRYLLNRLGHGKLFRRANRRFTRRRY